MPNASGGSVATRALPDAKDELKVRADGYCSDGEGGRYRNPWNNHEPLFGTGDGDDVPDDADEDGDQAGGQMLKRKGWISRAAASCFT